MKPSMRSLAFCVATAACVFLVAIVVGYPVWFSKIWRSFLVVESPIEQADAIVILGGESQARPLLAARLYNEGVAPRVFIIGTGDHTKNRRALLQAGVPDDRISIEKNSKTTWENAEFARPLLEAAAVRRALLVTSSFHARRALATFQQRIPGIEFGVTTSRIGWWDTPQGRNQEDEWARIEMWKIPAYWIFHGITPWIKTPISPSNH
ncbi:MAG: YdcF family protein [bacterium]